MLALLLLPLLTAPAPSWGPTPQPHALVVVWRAGAVRDPAARRARLAGLALTPGTTLAASAGVTRAPGLAFDPALVWRVEARDPAAAARAAAALAQDPDVQLVEPVVGRAPCVLAGPPNDPLYEDGRQWGLANSGDSPGNPGVAGADIRALAAWSRSVGANDLVLAIADTGIDPAHPDLAGAMPDGSLRVAALNVTGIDPIDAVADSFGHGTTVVGVMAARTNDGPHFDSLGVAGVCGGDGQGNAGCHILSLKITPGSSGFADDFAIASACLAAVNAGARALNLSFAGDDSSDVERATFRYCLAHGCTVVCASGNRGFLDGGRPQYPAAYAAQGLCIQVGACDALGQRVAFSSYGPGLDVLAPGVGIWTTFMTYPSHAGASYPGYVANSGTSLAAPFATGTVGLLAAARPELVDTDFQQILRRTARDTGAPGVDAETGAGLLDAGAALAAVASGVGVWHGVAAVQQLVPLETDTLRGQGGAPVIARGQPLLAQRYAAIAVVAVPDSFAGAPPGPDSTSASDTPWAWTRVTGTTTAAGDFRTSSGVPAAQVASVDARRLVLRGDLYRLLPAGGIDVPDSSFVPVAPESARIAFTLLGRIVHAPPPAVTDLRAFPNPFADAVTLMGPPGAVCAVVDVAGRRVQRLRLDATGRVTWDGRDASGRATRPGVYFARLAAPASRTLRLAHVR